NDPQQLAFLTEQFARNHAVVLPQFLSPDVLAELQNRVASATFELRSDYKKTGREYAREDAVEARDISVHFLRMLLNDPQLFRTLQQFTGCPAIAAFQGRIYRWSASADHFDDWHSDIGRGNLLGLTINLGGSYDGGVFQ